MSEWQKWLLLVPMAISLASLIYVWWVNPWRKAHNRYMTAYDKAYADIELQLQELEREIAALEAEERMFVIVELV